MAYQEKISTAPILMSLATKDQGDLVAWPEVKGSFNPQSVHLSKSWYWFQSGIQKDVANDAASEFINLAE